MYKHFNFGDVLGFGWRVMKAYFGFFFGVGVLYGVISYAPAIVIMVFKYSGLPGEIVGFLGFMLNVVSWLIGIVLSIGIMKIGLSFCDEVKPEVTLLFDAWDCFWNYLGGAILYGLIVVGGFLLFIIPGIIWSVQFSLWRYFVIDKGLGPIEALKASSRTTKGVKWELFGFQIVCGLIVMAGWMCLLVGVLAAYPIVLIGMALVYRQLVGQTPELAEFGIEVVGGVGPGHVGGEVRHVYGGPVEMSDDTSAFRRPQSEDSDDDSGPDIGDVTVRDE